MKIKTVFFRDIEITSAGKSVGRLFSSTISNIINGEVYQVVVEQTSGSATTATVKIRYEEEAGLADTIYENTTAALDLVDSDVGATFDLSTDFNYLTVHVQPDNTGTFDIRIDIKVY